VLLLVEADNADNMFLRFFPVTLGTWQHGVPACRGRPFVGFCP
jgi:hypothetical protein